MVAVLRKHIRRLMMTECIMPRVWMHRRSMRQLSRCEKAMHGTEEARKNLTLPPTQTFSSLFSTVHCLFSPRELAHTSPVHPNPWHDTLCHHKPHYIFPQNSHHTYLQGISIAFPRYIAMQHPPSHDLIFMSYMLLA